MDVVKEVRKLVGVTDEDGKDEMETDDWLWPPLKRRAHEKRINTVCFYSMLYV